MALPWGSSMQPLIQRKWSHIDYSKELFSKRGGYSETPEGARRYIIAVTPKPFLADLLQAQGITPYYAIGTNGYSKRVQCTFDRHTSFDHLSRHAMHVICR